MQEEKNISTAKNHNTSHACYTVNDNNTLSIHEMHANLRQELILITDDKLKLILHDSIRAMGAREKWLVPFGILMPILITLCTTTFQKFAGIPADSWKAFFIMSGLASFFWLIHALLKLKKSITVEDILSKVKNNRNQR